MKMRAKCKSKEELMALDSFAGIEEKDFANYGGLNFNVKKSKLNFVSSDMFDRIEKSLEYDEHYKQFIGTRSYHLEWLKDIVVYDDKLEIGLEIDGLTLTVKILKQDESIIRGSGFYKKFKDKYFIQSIDELEVKLEGIFILGNYPDVESDTYTFKSKKALRKWVSRLLRCE